MQHKLIVKDTAPMLMKEKKEWLATFLLHSLSPSERLGEVRS